MSIIVKVFLQKILLFCKIYIKKEIVWWKAKKEY